jgi:hypothetical protein
MYGERDGSSYRARLVLTGAQEFPSHHPLELAIVSLVYDRRSRASRTFVARPETRNELLSLALSNRLSFTLGHVDSSSSVLSKYCSTT